MIPPATVTHATTTTAIRSALQSSIRRSLPAGGPGDPHAHDPRATVPGGPSRPVARAIGGVPRPVRTTMEGACDARRVHAAGERPPQRRVDARGADRQLTWRAA